MTQQMMERKSLGSPSRKGHRNGLIAVILIIALLAAIVVALDIRTSAKVETRLAPSVNLSSMPADGRAYFTEPYWIMGAEAETAKSLTAIPQDGRAYFTEPYWNMAAEIEAAKRLSAIPQDGRAYFTEPYWNMAAGHSADEDKAEPTPEWSYYTERYWSKNR